MGMECGTHENKIGLYRVLVRKPEGIGLIGKPRHRLEDNIKMDFTQIV